MRKFAVAKGYEDKGVNLPKRATKNAAGYDFEAVEDIVVPSVWKQVISRATKEEFKPTMVPTGIKAQMEEDEGLFMFNRSGNPKLGLILANGVGVVDSDYFENKGNDGHIFFPFFNFFPWDVTVKKHDRVGQGVFQKYLLAEDDTANGTRIGGFGSTGK